MENEGIKKLRKAMLVYLIGAVLTLIGTIAGVLFLNSVNLNLFLASPNSSFPNSSFPNSTFPNSTFPNSSFPNSSFWSIMIICGIVMIISVIISVLALLLIRSGFKILASTNKELDLGILGATLQLAGVVILMLAVLVLLAIFLSLMSSIAGSVGATGSVGAGAGFTNALIEVIYVYIFLIIGGIIAFVGAILLLVAFLKLGSANDSTVIQVGAVFYLLFAPIGAILLYIGLGDLLKKPLKEPLKEPSSGGTQEN